MYAIRSYYAINARPIEIGTESNTRMLARRFTRNSISTMMIRTKASSKAVLTVLTAWFTRSDSYNFV